MTKKRGQISSEYLILISFILFLVLSTLGIAMFYSTQIKDSIKFSQVESFAKKIVSQSERVFYAGEPARTTLTAYLPDGVTAIDINGYELILYVSSAGGQSVISYGSNVNLTGDISVNSGVKRIAINATSTNVVISG